MKADGSNMKLSEFIVTYGPGIAVVIAAIIALAYFGILNPKDFVTKQPAQSCCDKFCKSISSLYVCGGDNFGGLTEVITCKIPIDNGSAERLFQFNLINKSVYCSVKP